MYFFYDYKERFEFTVLWYIIYWAGRDRNSYCKVKLYREYMQFEHFSSGKNPEVSAQSSLYTAVNGCCKKFACFCRIPPLSGVRLTFLWECSGGTIWNCEIFFCVEFVFCLRPRLQHSTLVPFGVLDCLIQVQKYFSSKKLIDEFSGICLVFRKW